MNGNEQQPDTGDERLARAEIAYQDLIAPINELRRAVVQHLRGPEETTHILGDLAISMWETHESMRAILKAAEEYEQDAEHLTGGHADAILLARPQLEAVFIALLILLDEQEYVPRYHRAGWAATLRSSYETHRALGHVDEIANWWTRQQQLFVEQGAVWGLTEAHLAVVVAEARDDELTPEQRAFRVRPLPMPGAIVNESLLEGSAFAALAEPLYRQWKVACDPVHLGIPILAAKSFLRGGAIDNVTGIDRAVYLTSDIHHNSIIRSAIGMLTCLTAIVVGRFGTDRQLLDRCVESWGLLRAHVPAAITIWNGWAESAISEAQRPDGRAED